MSGQRTLEQILIPAPGGFELIAGASGLSDIAQMTGYQRKKLIEQLFKLESDADYIIIDTGAGVGSNVLGFALSADEIIVVTTPEPTAITDAYAVMKTMAKCRKNLDLNVVVNMTRGKKEGAEVFQRVEAVSQRFLQLSPRFLGELPFDDAVFEAVRARQPFTLRSENCAASKQIKRIAATFDLSPARAKRAGLIHRISAWFGAGNSLTKAR